MGPSLGVDSKNVKFATLGLTAGLCIGAIFWGALSDKYGRKWAFNITLLVVALSGFLAGCARELWQSAICFGLLGFGLGGNLVVDGTLLLEFLPSRKKWLLVGQGMSLGHEIELTMIQTCLSISWGIGALLASTLGWGILPRTSCAEGEMSCRLATEGEPCCAREDNRGWQYVLWTMSGLTLFFWAWRSLAFGGWESPHFLLSNGQITQAVAVVRGVAYLNHRSTWLTKALLNDAGNGHEVATASSSDSPTGQFSLQTFRQLLGERKRCINTILLWFAWAAIGLGFPLYNLFLPQYLANNGTDKPTSLDTTYRSYLVTSATGLAGSIVAAVVINCPILGYRLGCRKTMAASAALSGTFVFLFTVRSNSDWQLGFSSAQAFCQNIMYGTLFAYTPMTFPTMYRGTGTGIGGFLNRLFGTLAPVMAVYLTMSSVKAPIYVSGALFLCAFVAMCFLPIETAPNKARGQRTATPMREVGAS